MSDQRPEDELIQQEIPPEAPACSAQTHYPVSGWTTRNLDEKIVPASEHARLTDRKSTDAAQGRSCRLEHAHQDGQRMKEK
jgi:hypothetical protein